jgi:hypothetical protein
MLKLIYPDNTKGMMQVGVFAENTPFEVFMDLALQGISWELPSNIRSGSTSLGNQIKQADLRVRPSIFFIREEHANARTLH